MSRRAVLVAVAGSAVLLGGLPALAEPRPSQVQEATEQRALDLLGEAARAARSLTYSGTQYVATWRNDGGTTTLVDIEHSPRRGAVVTLPPTAAGLTDQAQVELDTAGIDERVLRVLADTYQLRVGGPGRCAGRDATTVEAVRDDGSAAGRFWLDDATGLLLRREVFDEQGRRTRSSAYVDLEVDQSRPPIARPVTTPAPSPRGADAGSRVSATELDRLRDLGWEAPDGLPAGFRLFDARVREHAPGGRVLHLAYSDGLSTLSLFAQRGELGGSPMDGFDKERVAGVPVWVRSSSPERVVWSGGGRVWTLVSDAPAGAVREAVAALPHDPPPREGLLGRLGRGLTRLGSILNPFD